MKIRDLIFPQTIKCFMCGCEIADSGVCGECYGKLPWVRGNLCERCGGVVLGTGSVCNDCSGEKFYFHRNFNVFNYVDDMQKNILRFKKGRKYLGYYFSEIMREYLEKLPIHFDYIIPMPIHENRLKERSFNQSDVLVEKLKDKYVVDSSVLKRIKDTPHQTGLNKSNRKSNLDKAFEVIDKDKVKDKIILVVDDIYTTGSTLNECAKTLVKSGAKGVYGLCLARAVFNDVLE